MDGVSPMRARGYRRAAPLGRDGDRVAEGRIVSISSCSCAKPVCSRNALGVDDDGVLEVGHRAGGELREAEAPEHPATDELGQRDRCAPGLPDDPGEGQRLRARRR